MRRVGRYAIGALVVAIGLDVRAPDVAAQESKSAATAEEDAQECPEPEPPLTDEPGLERLVLELEEREKALERRAAELAERERSVASLEAEAARRVEELETLALALEQRIESIEAEGNDRLKRLAKVYSEMPPGRAAPLLESLEPELATEIVRRMKHKDSAAVLSVMAEPHALLLSRRVARPLSGAIDVGARR